MQFVEKLRLEIETPRAKRLHAVLEYLIAVILLISCNSIWVTILPIRYYTDAHLMIWLGFACAGCVVLTGAILSKKRLQSCAIGFGALAVYSLVFFLAQDVGRPSFAYYIGGVLILLIYVLACFDGSVPSLLIRYSNVIAVVAAFSVVMWLLCSVLRIIPPTGVAWTSWNALVDTNTPVDSYFGVYFTMQGMRNTSIFAEAPMAALHYGLALLIQVFLASKTDLKKVIVLVVAIVTTISTMGYLIAAFAVGCYVLFWMAQRGWLRKRAVQLSLAAVFLLGVAAVIVVMKWKVDTTSGSLRSDDLLAGWKSLVHHPLFGNGHGNLRAIRRHMSEWRHFNLGYSSGLMWVLSDGGIWFAAAYLYPIIRAVVYGIRRRQIKIVLFAIALFVIVLITVFHYSFLMTLLLLFLAMVGRERAPIKDADCGQKA
jgi:hypothetical protein